MLILAAALSLVCYHAAGRYRYAGILSESIAKISDYYVEPVDRRVLFEGALNGMLNQLDPYSGYIPPEELALFRVDLEQEYGGIGIEVGMLNDRLTILSPIPDSPAYQAGLLAGDTILSIDGRSTDGFTLTDAAELMRGPVGSPVRLTVLHRGEEQPVDVTLQRAKIRVESIRGDTRTADGQWNFVLQQHPRIGYIRLTSFGDHTAEDLQRALAAIDGRVDGLIMDLRDNAGGLLDAAVDVCELFLPPDKLIVSTRGRDPSLSEDYVTSDPTSFDDQVPLVVLVNQFSASASEIFAACLQDHGRAEIVGERTWGKGTVQNVIEIEGGRSAIRLTTQTYWRPSGTNIHRHRNATADDVWGVQPQPEYLVPLSPEQYRQVFEQRRLRDVPPAPPTSSNQSSAPAVDPPPVDPSAVDPSAVDPQLQKAIEYIQRHDRKRAVQVTRSQGSDDRRLFARRRADVLARSRAEAGFRPGGSAVGVHGHEHLVRLAHALGSCGRVAGAGGPPPHDEDGPAHDLSA